MPVVFDEVVGTVEAEPAPAPDEAGRAGRPKDHLGHDAIRQYLARAERREARLRAD